MQLYITFFIHKKHVLICSLISITFIYAYAIPDNLNLNSTTPLPLERQKHLLSKTKGINPNLWIEEHPWTVNK